ncbi:hypothetical protein M8C21_014348 [Ambrosia artemisiifolia]|uniref:EXS (ERD1/XPR1/SYG1) family protein n=1 Tax=Ambrosia artemisiifolia TaxID=4212 RepID=A0AAD5BMV0_AMBAR|nr:hypothetical protein M8C21_014348 [Ambrosia artemisiifolia]
MPPVHSKVEWTASKGVLYQTELLEQSDHTEAASAFFALLDLQLNKVNEFYIKKEKAFLERGECLEKQLHILVELKTALKDKQKSKANSSHRGSKDEVTISGTILCDEESNRGMPDQSLPDEETITEDMENNDMPSIVSPRSEETGEKMPNMEEGQSVSSSISNHNGKNLKIRIPLTNPTRAFSYLLWEDLINQSSKKHNSQGKKLHINKTKVHHAEKMIRGALIELYKGLGYLKTYRNLNLLAFAKILKKFDKVTNKQVLPVYLKVVESSYFNCSNKIMKLADEVEEIFVKQFTEDDRRKAMKYLKPTQRKESHSVTFFIGLFTGCFIALLIGWLDEGDTGHLINMGKYASAMLAAGAKLAYEKEKSVGWLCVVVIVSSIATVYQLYWDFVKDWGLLQMNSKNPWLRNELILRQKFIYFFSMGLNLVLRLAWIQTVLHYNFGGVDYRLTGLFFAALEVIRRGHWNFYRLENEHLNNAGKFRAVKTVPLPFQEVDEQD